MPKLIIGLCGLIGCGKGTAADIFQRDYGAGYFRFSQIIGDLLARVYLPKTRDNFINMSEVIRKTFGDDLFSYTIEKDMLAAPDDVVILDGIRRLGDISALEPLPQFKLVAIDTDAKLRFERIKKRGEKAGERDLTWKEFLEDEARSTETTIPEVMERAWRTVPNNGTYEEFAGYIHEMMRDLQVPVKTN